MGGCSNSIRGIFAGGYNPSEVSTVEFVTIASLGNASNFGNLSAAKRRLLNGQCSDSHGGIG
tara:strand:+ start:748 stop:933 length:186 start_codon:yes stop_codon:yes gene_type:complete